MHKILLPAALALATLGAQAATVAPPADLAGWTCTGVCGTSGAQGDITLSPLANPAYGWVSTWDSQAFGVSPLALSDNSEGIETNGSRWVSGSFTAQAGDRFDMRFNYVSTDGKGFDDYAWARLVDAGTGQTVSWLFTARSTNSNTGNVVPGDVLDKKDFDPRDVIVDYDSFEFTSKTSDDPIDWQPLGGSNGSCWRDNAPGCGFTGWLHSSVAFAQGGSYRIELGVVNWGDTAFDSGLAFDFAGLTAPVPEPASFVLALLGLGALGLRRYSSVPGGR